MTRDGSHTDTTGDRRIDSRKQQLRRAHTDLSSSLEGDDDGSSSRGSRRRFLQVGATALAATAIGSSTVAAQEAARKCGSHAQLEIGAGDFVLKNNDWGSSDVDMCIRTNTDGSYGYEWSTRSSGGPPNYPQGLLGTKPWGSDTGVRDFPIRRGDVDQLDLEVDVDVNISGGSWNLAEEWWLMDSPVSEQTQTHTHEIMVVLDWGGGHGHGGVKEENVWTDKFGNTIDYWARYGGGGTSADFHIFRVSGGLSTGRVDLTEAIDFMTERWGVSDRKWISGIELGNEYWQGSQGDVTYDQFDVTVNGTTYSSGSGSGGGDTGGGNRGGESDPGNDGENGTDEEDGRNRGEDGNGDETGNGGEDGNGDETGNGGEDGNGDETGNGGEDGNGDETGNGGEDGNGDETGNGGEDGNGDETGNGGEDGNGDETGNGGEDGNGDETGNGGEDGNGGDGNDDSRNDNGGSDGGESYPTWQPDTIYLEGDRVVHDGAVWESQWWAHGEEPREEQWYVWKRVEDANGVTPVDPDAGGTPAWNSSEIYREGDRVTHDGTTWEAQWWTQGQEPRDEAWYVWRPVE
ncbi:carbohydrate-binding protein [Natrinema caseinilyticum]|uniref:carbohydrate-binding protein n=1 Tax=Natrinema caseinilyticum TaxID=2961570 RepID=UPI002413F588|nr:carbohydrate-binding protein [Natrinema caseinilyticum]